MRKMNVFKIGVAAIVIAFISCSEDGDVDENIDLNAAIVFTVDGKTRTINAKDVEKEIPYFEDSPIIYAFRKKLTKNEKPEFDVAFAFDDKENLGDLPKTYDLTEDPYLIWKTSLNFFDYERKVEKDMRKRLVFDKGTITVYELDKNKIRFDFDGEVNELNNLEGRSKVSGSVNVTY